MTPSGFPILFRHARAPEKLGRALEAMRAGLEAGAIRNVVWQDAKGTLARAIEAAWTAHVGTPWFHAGRWEQRSEEARSLNDRCRPTGVHELAHVSRRLEGASRDDPAIRAMLEICDELMPLVGASERLKGMVVKGRAAPARSRPVNPDQERGTCSCCFREIAITGQGRMAHHGYERPGDGMQTQSCAGIRFQPLERSTEGLEWLVSTVSRQRDELRERWERRDRLERLHVPVRRGRPGTIREVTRADPDWPERLEDWTRITRMRLRGMNRHLEDITERLRVWKARHEGPEP